MSRAAAGGRILKGASIALALVALLAAVAYTLAARAVEGRIREAIGAEGSVDEISLGLGRIEIVGLRMPAVPGWPAPMTASARRVVIVPELGTLLSDTVRIASVSIEGGYFSAVRSGDGRIRIWPRVLGISAAQRALAEGAPAAPPDPGRSPRAGARPPPTTTLARVTLVDGTIELHDSAVRSPAHVIRIEGIDGEMREMSAPFLDRRSPVRLTGTVKADPARGAAHDGRIELEGWVRLADGGSALRVALRRVDAVVLQPYLKRALGASVSGGALDLDLDARVEARRLRAPGRLALADLRLGAGDPVRQAAVALLQDRGGRIEFGFTVEGRLDDPSFSLTEDVAGRIASALAERVGGGLGGAGREALESAAGALRGLIRR